MNRQQKEQIIESLKNNLHANKLSFVVGYKGLSVDKLMALRRKLQKGGAILKVAKVTFIKRAIEESSEAKALMPFLSNQIALVFSKEESSAVAKTLHDFSRDNEQFHLLGGCFDKQVMNPDSIKAFALLPSREVLLGQLCGLLKAPVTKLAVVLKMASEHLNKQTAQAE